MTEFVSHVSDAFTVWPMDSGFRRSDEVGISYAIALAAYCRQLDCRYARSHSFAMPTPNIKATYSLDDETARALPRLAQHWNVSQPEALRRAICTAAGPEPTSPSERMIALQTPHDVSVIGPAIYQERILPTLSPSYKGKVVFIDVKTGGYEIDGDECAAMVRFMERFPNAVGWSERVGYPYVDSFGYSDAFRKSYD